MTVTTKTVSSGYSTGTINENFQTLEDYINNNLLNRDGTSTGEVNQMGLSLDMNSNFIFNLPEPTLEHQAARLQDVQNALADNSANLITFTPYKHISSDNVQGALQELIDEAGEATVSTSTGEQSLSDALDLRGPVFDTVSDMVSSTTLTAGAKCRTLGYYTVGDGGGNDYEIVAASTGTEDGGSFINLGGSGFQAEGLFPNRIVDVAQFGASPESGFDNAPAFKAASAYAKLVGAPYVNIGLGTFEVDTSASAIQSTDSTVVFLGSGMRKTVVKASAVCNDVFLFDTETTTGGERIPSGGLDNLSIDGSLLAEHCVRTVSTNFGFFDRLAIEGALDHNFLATTQNGQPSSQHNYYGTLEILAEGSANGFKGDGSQDPGGNGNWSLNYVQNVYTLLRADSTGSGFVFGFSDGNYVAHLRNFRVAGATGQAIVFLSDNTGVVTGGAHARLNVISHCQTGAAGCLATAGTEFSSSNTILNYSTGNGSPDPIIQNGARLGFSKNTIDGMRGTFTPEITSTGGGGPVTHNIQKGRYQVTTGRLEFDLEVSITAVNGLSGNIRIGGLPYAMSNDTGTDVNSSCSIGRHKVTLPAGMTQLGAEMLQGQTAMQLVASGDGANPSVLGGGNLISDSVFRISGSYSI